MMNRNDSKRQNAIMNGSSSHDTMAYVMKTKDWKYNHDLTYTDSPDLKGHTNFLLQLFPL